MENNIYLASKSVKKKKARKGLWVILIIAVVFIVVILRYVRNSEDRISRPGLPEKEDAYKVAKAFLKADTHGAEQVDFADDGFSFGKKTDSIYVIRSTFEKHLEGGDIKKGNFSVTMRYKGGINDDQNNWDLLNINKD